MVVQDVTIGADASKRFSAAAFKMTKLQTLRLQTVKLDIQFFSVMSDMAQRSQVITWLP